MAARSGGADGGSVSLRPPTLRSPTEGGGLRKSKRQRRRVRLHLGKHGAGADDGDTADQVGRLVAARLHTEAGYGTEAAFNRAVSRACGMPPSAWRRAARLKGS